MLTVRTPNNRREERSYILSVLLGEFLGLAWNMVPEARNDVEIILDGATGAVVLPDILISTPPENWLRQQSMPTQPLMLWDAGTAYPEARLVKPALPVLYGQLDTPSVPPGSIALPLDVFGSCFFMLSRYEEVAALVLDRHGRFPAYASLAYAEGFLDRPIVNEYTEILWSAMKRLWPQLVRKERHGRSLVSCDVDEPYLASSRSLSTLLRQAGGDILKRCSFASAARRALGYAGALLGNDRLEPGNTFDWMMDINEQAGNVMAFYFIADKSVPGLDGSAPIDDPFVLSLMTRIHRRGHEIGLHGSYASHQDGDRLQREADLLRAAMDLAGAQQPLIGTRQHFLRWRTPITARLLSRVGLEYDTSLGYADSPGFRCGTCYPFQLFDLEMSETLRLLERPLIVMESSVISDQYLGLGYSDEARETILELKRRVARFGGDFALLWHNSHFMTQNDRQLYADVIGENI